MKWACNQCCLAACKRFPKKSLENPNLHLMTTFSPFLVTLCYPIKLFFCFFEVPQVPHGTCSLKRKPISKKSVKPRVTFSWFKASFLDHQKSGNFCGSMNGISAKLSFPKGFLDSIQDIASRFLFFCRDLMSHGSQCQCIN